MWDNFDYDEFACKCGCESNHMSIGFIDDLQVVRNICGFPFVITSGYRCAAHPIEAAKDEPGPHNTGLAVDIACNGLQALEIFWSAYHEFEGFGINQKGDDRFIHLDQCEPEADRPRPWLWSY